MKKFNLKRKFIIFCLFAFAVFSLVVSLTLSQGVGVTYAVQTVPPGSWVEPENFTDVLQEEGMNLEQWVAGNLPDTPGEQRRRGFLDALVEGLAGQVNGYYDDQGRLIAGGATGTVSNMLAFLYTTKPASTDRYLAYLRDKFELGKPAYAQGTGWKAMEPILPLWQTMRNVAYIFFIVIFVFIGFAVMFRQKIDPQTAISIQNALPKIVVALILVTFSYAIAGLLIDLQSLLTYLIVSILTTPWLKPSGIQSLIEQLTNRNLLATPQLNPIKIVANIFTIAGALLSTSKNMVEVIQTVLGGLPIIGGIVACCGPLLPIGSSLLSLIIGIAVLQAVLKLFFALLTAYVSIVLLTIFSPFAFLMGALPGGKSTGWLKSMLSNILVFPGTFLIILLAAILSRPPSDFPFPLAGVVNPGARIPGFTYSPIPLGLFWENAGGGKGVIAPLFLNYLIAFGLVMAAPRVGEIIKSFIEGGQAPAVGGEIETGIKGAARHLPIVGGLIG